MRGRAEDLADIPAANAAFSRQVAEVSLRYRCEDCAHGDPLADSPCSLGYPNGMLRGPHRAITDAGSVTFCKYFELGEG